jgi:hypothetical protein
MAIAVDDAGDAAHGNLPLYCMIMTGAPPSRVQLF